MLKKSRKAFPNSIGNVFHSDDGVEIVKATSEHAAYLQHRLRPTDMRECMIAGTSPWAALHRPLTDKNGRTWTILFDDEPACMYGVSVLSPENEFNMANIWLLGSNLVEKHSRRFVRTTRQIVEHLQEQYMFLENVVPIDHDRTIKWLDRLGFQFAEETTIINGFACVRFVRCQDFDDMELE